MKILIVKPDEVPEVTEINGDLKEMQQVVGGTIQVIYPFPDEVALVCNDEGKLMALPLNRGLRDASGNLYDIVCGTFFLCGARSDEDYFSSLIPEQLSKYEKMFHSPEGFVNMNGWIMSFPMK